MQKCKFKTSSDTSKNARSFGATLLVVTPDGFESLKATIFPTMRPDVVTKSVQEDRLICEFGARMLQHHKDHHMRAVISRKMRELGRLKLEMKAKIKIKPGDKPQFDQLEDFIHPDLYKQIVECVYPLSGFDKETGHYKSPSLAKKIGFSLNTCAELMECKGIMVSSEGLRKRGENFSKLMDKMWKFYISLNASQTLSKAKWNKPKMLPLAEDLKQLHDFLTVKEKDLINQLKQHPTELAWRELAEISLVRIILRNRRRSGEAQRIKLSQYETINKQAVQSDTTELLSEMEKTLCKSR